MDQYSLDLIDHLSEYITGKRLALFRQVLEERTRYITVLLEDIYQSQNASAVLRTCDCTGVQDVHIVEQDNEYEINRDVALGSNQWLSLHYYHNGDDNISLAVEALKSNGYRIVATSPHREGQSPESIDLGKGKVALLFGTELNGLSDRALDLADEYLQIPMVGFTESYNISVSAALVLYALRKRLEGSALNWKITREEKNILLLDWLRHSIKMSAQIEKKFRENRSTEF